MHCPLGYPGFEADIEMSRSFSLDSSNNKKKVTQKWDSETS